MSDRPSSNLRQRPLNMASNNESEHFEGDSDRQPNQEDQPLLGGPGDAVQDESTPIWKNLYMGTAVVAQGGIVILTVLVWVSVLTKDIMLFSAHPVSHTNHDPTPSRSTSITSTKPASLTHPHPAPQLSRPPLPNRSNPNPPTDLHPHPKAHRRLHPRNPKRPRRPLPPSRPRRNPLQQNLPPRRALRVPACNPRPHHLQPHRNPGHHRRDGAVYAEAVWQRGECEESV